MNFICTWFCSDDIGEESFFPQTGLKSSSREHKLIYWKCVAVFFTSSMRHNPNAKHLLFTNTNIYPIIDGIGISELLHKLGVEIHVTPFDFKTPPNYYNSFQNQFYEFSILQYISKTFREDDLFLIADSDCVFNHSGNLLFDQCISNNFLAFSYDAKEHEKINGLSRLDMKLIYSELIGHQVDVTPTYFLGEFLLASGKVISAISKDFKKLWPELIARHSCSLLKFNEEAHTLSYLYYKQDLKPCNRKNLMRRIWTNPLVFRDVQKSDIDVCLWHMPGEKGFGFQKMWKFLVDNGWDNFNQLKDVDYHRLIRDCFSVPDVPFRNFINYIRTTTLRRAKRKLDKLIEKLN